MDNMKNVATLLIKPFKGSLTPKTFLYRGEACFLEGGLERFYLSKKKKRYIFKK
jgi:hypothetical protein